MRQFLLTTGVSVLFVAVICGRSNAQTWEKELFFRNISTDEGLSNPTVNSMCEDARGYIWIGTLDGLNRYDGNEFKVYQPNPADSNSLPSGRINVLYEDSNFNLWIGTNEGLCQFNYKIEQFKNYKGEKVFDRVFDIAHDNRNNRIWMVSSHGQMKYLDLESGIINVFTNELLETGIAMCVENVNDDELYIGTANNGVYKLDLNSFTVEEFCNTKKGQFQIPNDWVRVLHHTDNRLFIGTEGGVIVHRFRDEKQFYYSPKNSSLPSAYITDITHDGNGDIYVGTKDGMAIYNSKTELISSQNTEGGSESAIRPSIKIGRAHV